VEQRAGVLRRLEQEDVVVLLGDVVAEGPIAGSDQMRVRVDQEYWLYTSYSTTLDVPLSFCVSLRIRLPERS